MALQNHHVVDFLAVLKTYLTVTSVELDGAQLRISTIAALGENPCVQVKLSHGCKLNVERARAWVEKAVDAKQDIYGITTGFNAACSDKRTFQVEELQVEFLRHLIAGIFGPAAGEGAQPLTTTRAAMAIRLNSLLLGLSGIRWGILEALAKLVNTNVLPRCPLRGTVTASGDFMPLAYMAGLLVAWPTVKAYVRGGNEVLPAADALKLAGIDMPVKLGAKEGIALANGTSFATAEAALVLFDMHMLFLLSELCAGLFCEVMHVRAELADPVLHEAKNHCGQIEVAATLKWLLDDSALIQRGDEIHSYKALKKPRQDRYATRSIPHWLGPQLECIRHAIINVQNEANSANDNPLIDAKNDRSLHGANFQGTFIAFPMDNVRVAIAAIGKLLFAQFSELMLEMTNNGLTGNLACGPDFALDFGLKGVDIAMASYMSEMLHLSAPLTAFVQSAEQHNQDVNSLGLISARKTAEAVQLLKMMLASFIVALCQAVDLRHLEEIIQTVMVDTIKQEGSVSALPPQLITELINIVYNLNVFECAHDVGNPTLPFMAAFNDTLLKYSFEQVGHHEDTNSTKSVYMLQSFKMRLQSMLVDNVEKAWKSCSESQVKSLNTRIRSSKTFPLYHFVREQLGTKILSGSQAGCRSPDEDVQKVFDAIHSKRIIEPLMACFENHPNAHIDLSWIHASAIDLTHANKQGFRTRAICQDSVNCVSESATSPKSAKLHKPHQVALPPSVRIHS